MSERDTRRIVQVASDGSLALKGLSYDYKAVHIANNEQFAESYAAVSAARMAAK